MHACSHPGHWLGPVTRLVGSSPTCLSLAKPSPKKESPKKERTIEARLGPQARWTNFDENLVITWSRNPHAKTPIPGKPSKSGLIGV